MFVWLFSLVFFFFSSAVAHQKTALVCGGGGFIGHHLVNRYKQEGYWVRAVDLKYPEYQETQADEFLIMDLRLLENAKKALYLPNDKKFDEVCQLAANMGGMGFISTHDAEIMHDSALINLHILEECRRAGVGKLFFSSSACIYPLENQLEPENPNCCESSAYPAHPDTEYGWEKLFAERMYQAYARDYGMHIVIARFHNIFGPLGTWKGGREKAPAALCRKIALANDGDTIEVWGNGDQTRSFLYIDECIEGIRKMMLSNSKLPVLNIGSKEMISINDLVHLIAKIAHKNIEIKNVPGPEGVRGRNSDNTLIQEELEWQPSQKLEVGLTKLYPWIVKQIEFSQMDK